jgi:signal transduction histidine kinase
MMKHQGRLIVFGIFIAIILSVLILVINIQRFSWEILVLDFIIITFVIWLFFGLFLPLIRRDHQTISQQKIELDKVQNILRTTLKGLPIGVLYINEKEEIEWFNELWRDWINAKNESLKLSDFSTFPILFSTINKVIGIEQKESLVFSNKLITVEVNIIPVHENKQFLGVLLIGNDISHRHYYERIQDKFIADLTHEIKTPLTSIISITEMLQNPERNPSREKRHEFQSLLLEEAQRVNRLIDNLMELRQYKNYYLRSIKTQTNIYQLVKNCFNINALTIEEKKLKTSIKIDPNLSMFVDADKFRQVFLNLMSNAIRYTQKGSIEVEAIKDDSKIKIWFRDTGSGIEKENLSRVFDRFFRTDYARTRYEGGSGLGLAITKEIIKSHKGTITVKSKIGVGTEFLIVLPNLE